MNFDERPEWLLKEIGELSWDIIVFTETWRAERVEVWRTADGHTWLGSGGMERQRGVGFLLHSRWQHLRFKPLSERVGVVDIKLHANTVIRIAGVYMPHGGQSDDSVEQVYSTLAEQCDEATEKGYNILLAGDFNAEVGICSEFDDKQIVGLSSLPARSDRGAWLLHWCTFHRYKILSTFGEGVPDNFWTYRNGVYRKVLDHFLGDSFISRCMTGYQVLSRIDTGSDHRPSMLSLRGCLSAKRRRKKKKNNHADWKPDSKYVDRLTHLLSRPTPDLCDASSKAGFLQDSLLAAYEESLPPPSSIDFVSASPYDSELRRLISERREIINSGLSAPAAKAKRITLGKQIQKIVRRKHADEKTEKSRIYYPNFVAWAVCHLCLRRPSLRV
jgi:exonuclease III